MSSYKEDSKIVLIPHFCLDMILILFCVWAASSHDTDKLDVITELE